MQVTVRGIVSSVQVESDRYGDHRLKFVLSSETPIGLAKDDGTLNLGDRLPILDEGDEVEVTGACPAFFQLLVQPDDEPTRISADILRNLTRGQTWTRRLVGEEVLPT